MTAGPITVDGKPYFIGRSISGYRTNIHLNEQDANSEEAWLNRMWMSACLLWDVHNQELINERRNHLLKTVLDVMWYSQIGLRPIESTNAPGSARLFRSEHPGEDPRVLAELQDGTFYEFEGADLRSIQADLTRAIEGRQP